MNVGWPVGRARLAGFPIREGEEMSVFVTWRVWGRVEAGLVGLASADGFLHGVVDSRDDLLG